jgi:hypothetical protein
MTNDDNYPLERRRKPRITLPFPLTIRGSDGKGTRFTTTAVVMSLCCQGVSFRVLHPIEPGVRVFLLIRLSTTPSEQPAPHVAAHVRVQRIMHEINKGYVVAGEIIHQRFLCVPAA